MSGTTLAEALATARRRLSEAGLADGALDARLLIINCDDLGMSHAANEGVLRDAGIANWRASWKQDWPKIIAVASRKRIGYSASFSWRVLRRNWPAASGRRSSSELVNSGLSRSTITTSPTS